MTLGGLTPGQSDRCLNSIGLQYIRNNNCPEIEKLNETMAKEAHCTCIETLDGKFTILVGTHYLPTAVTGNNQLMS